MTTSLAFMFTPAGGYPALIHLARLGKDRLGGFLNKAACAAAPRTRFGTLGRDTLRGPGQANLDFSVQKRFVLKDSDCYNCVTIMFPSELPCAPSHSASLARTLHPKLRCCRSRVRLAGRTKAVPFSFRTGHDKTVGVL